MHLSVSAPKLDRLWDSREESSSWIGSIEIASQIDRLLSNVASEWV